MTLQFCVLPSDHSRSSPPKQLVVLIHGYGASGQNLINVAHNFRDHYIPSAHFIAPNAPFPYEGGCDGYQWFSMQEHSEQYILSGLNKAIPILLQFIEEQLDKFNLTYHDLALMGFSQGGMLALHTALQMSVPPKGVICYSGMLIASAIPVQANISNTKFILVHGKEDQIVVVEAATETYEVLKSHNIDVALHLEQWLGHGISLDGIKVGGAFLSSLFKNKN
ncbi:phospholipase/carboxylesterase [Alphaproteobacteria bacterium]